MTYFTQSALALAIASSCSVTTISQANEQTHVQTQKKPVEVIVVTATKENKLKSELAESIGVLNEENLNDIAPSHPAEALNRIPGVYINNLGGEGHMTSIRQPITTAGVYLFLEDGVPARPTGFFNHNGLYEVNIVQSSAIEVTKGPGSALYGSDAIGGIINTITKASPKNSEVSVNAEMGSDAWQRVLLSLGSAIGKSHGYRFSINSTKSDTFRDEADYDRLSLSLRTDSDFGDKVQVKNIFTYSEIDQSGASDLEEDEYRHNPEKNLYHGDIGFREVDALRISSEINYHISDEQLLTVTPFYRDNTMNMMPSWMVTYDANISKNEFQSYGTLVKFRQKFSQADIIVGFDYDRTPSTYHEQAITITKDNDIYLSHDLVAGEANYDFSATQSSYSPYLHTEYQLNDQLRLNAGIRYDKFDVDYHDKLTSAGDLDKNHLRPESQSLSYSNTSPKLGAVYQLNDNHNVYLSYKHAFRAPTVGTLFRSGSSVNTTELEPVTSVSTEVGFRGNFDYQLNYEIALYDMETENDIVSVINGNSREVANAGKTSHKGIEIGLDAPLSDSFQLGISYTYTEQKYEDFAFNYFTRDCFCRREINFAGNDVAKAPKNQANIRLAYAPIYLDGFRSEIEWTDLGSYYINQTNTEQYDGHSLINWRNSYDLNDRVTFSFRITNLTDERYSTSTSNQVGSDVISYRPGAPRSIFAGIRASF